MRSDSRRDDVVKRMVAIRYPYLTPQHQLAVRLYASFCEQVSKVDVPHLIAVDWGTSSLRGARLDAAGSVLEEKSAPLGILNVPNGDFCARLRLSVRRLDEARRQRLPDLGHGRQPAGLGRGALRRLSGRSRRAEEKKLHWIEPGRIALVPGLSVERARRARRDARRRKCRSSARCGSRHSRTVLFVLPGTHSKWATVRGGPHRGFSHLHDRRVLWPAQPAFDPGAHARGRCDARRGDVPSRCGASR